MAVYRSSRHCIYWFLLYRTFYLNRWSWFRTSILFTRFSAQSWLSYSRSSCSSRGCWRTKKTRSVKLRQRSLPSHSCSATCITIKTAKKRRLRTRSTSKTKAMLTLTAPLLTTIWILSWRESSRSRRPHWPSKTTISSITLYLVCPSSSLAWSQLRRWLGWISPTKACSCFKPSWSASAYRTARFLFKES